MTKATPKFSPIPTKSTPKPTKKTPRVVKEKRRPIRKGEVRMKRVVERHGMCLRSAANRDEADKKALKGVKYGSCIRPPGGKHYGRRGLNWSCCVVPRKGLPVDE